MRPSAPPGGAHTPSLQTHRFQAPPPRAQLVSASLRPGSQAPRAPRPPRPGPGSGVCPLRAPRAAGSAADLGPRRAASGSRGLRERRRGGRAGGGAAAGSPSQLGVRRPPGAAMEVYIPSFRYEESDLERGYTVGAGRAMRPEAAEPERGPLPRPPSPPLRGPFAPSPPPAQRKGCAPALLSRKPAPPPRRGCGGRPGAPIPALLLPSRLRVWEQKPGSRVPGHGTRHSPAARPLEPRLGCDPSWRSCPLCPDRSGFSAAGCGLPSSVGFVQLDVDFKISSRVAVY